MADDEKIGYQHGALYLEEIERGMQDIGLQKLLDYNIGIISAKGQFLNDYLNYIHRVEGNLLVKGKLKQSEGLNCWDIIHLMKKMAQKKQAHPVDILFVSRNRKVKIKTEGGYLEGDYVFYSIMDQLKWRYPQFKFDIFIIDDIYKGYHYLAFNDIITALSIFIKKSLQWHYLKGGLMDRMEKNKCEHVAAGATNFFQHRALLRSLLIGFSMKHMLDMFNPKVLIMNDDCITIKPLSHPHVKEILMQSARMAVHLEVCRKILFEDKGTKPDYFLVSGEVFRKMKEQCGAAERIVVTGLPRYDVLSSASQIYSRSDFLKRYGIGSDKKIILWLTQSHFLSDEENERNIGAIFGAIKQMKNSVLMIKQHPAEPPIYAQIIEKNMQAHEIDIVLTPKDADTYELLYVSDLMITKNSTTAMEAVALGKPIIALNLSGQPDSVEYVQEGVALGITDSHLLKDAIENLLKSDDELAINRETYIKNYLYRIDGKATQRAIDIILDCLNPTFRINGLNAH